MRECRLGSTRVSGPIAGDSSDGLIPAVTGAGTQGTDGVLGTSDTAVGVVGLSTGDGIGVRGSSLTSGDGVYGVSATGYGVHGQSTSNNGVHGEADSARHSAVAGVHSAGGDGVYGQSTGNAGHFRGNL